MPRARIAGLAVAAAWVACSDPPSPRAAAAADLLRVYAGEVRLGERIGVTRATVPALTLLPYVGYRDTSFQSADGFSDLIVVLDGMPRTATFAPSPSARSLALQVSTQSAAAAQVAERRLRAALGGPQEGCNGQPRDALNRVLYWRHERGGVALIVPVGSWTVTLRDSAGRSTTWPRSATIVFDRDNPGRFVTWARRCEALLAG
jgi:hypothetical protein